LFRLARSLFIRIVFCSTLVGADTDDDDDDDEKCTEINCIVETSSLPDRETFGVEINALSLELAA
jgi:hypothetical protein